MPKILLPPAPVLVSGEGDDFARVEREVANTKRRLETIGMEDLAKTPDSPSLLTGLLDNLMRSSYGASNLLREMLFTGGGKTPQEFDPISAFKRGWTLEEKTQGKDIAKGLGFSDKPLFEAEPFGIEVSPSPAGIAGLGIELLNPTDLLNWITFKTGSAVTRAGKAGTEILEQAFGRKATEAIRDLLGEETIKDISARSVGELANRLSLKAKPGQRGQLAETIYEGMKLQGTVTSTKLPGHMERRPVVTQVSIPYFNKSITEVPIPGSQYVSQALTSVGDAFARSRIGESLGRKFSTTFVPRTVPNTVMLRVLTGEIHPGDPRWNDTIDNIVKDLSHNEEIEKAMSKLLKGDEEAVSRLERVEGAEAYREIKSGLQRTFEKSRQVEDIFTREVVTIFHGLSDAEKRAVFNHAALGTPIEQVDKNIQHALKEFINWRESVIKQYHGMGIPVRELENYVPFIVVGGRLSKEEAQLLKTLAKARQKGEGIELGDQEKDLYKIAAGLDPHLHERSIHGLTPKEINEILGREWLTEDAALAMAMRGTRFIRAKHVLTFLQGMLTKYGLTLGDVQKLKGGVTLPKNLKSENLAEQLKDFGIDVNKIISLRDLPEGYGLYTVKADPSGKLSLEPAREIGDGKRKAYALPEEFVRAFNEYVDLYFNPQAQDGITYIFDRLTSAFRTVAYLWNPGHIPRDLLSNVFNAWLGGVRSYKPYQDALRLSHPLINEGNRKEFFFVPAKGKEYSGEELYETARRLGVVDTGQALGETPKSIQAELGGRPLYHPKKYSELYTKLMINLTRMADNTTRFAMWLDGLSKGMNTTEAAVHVKKYLFDYFDLTPFERRVMRRIIPFYTWLRKNIPLQLENVLKQPGKFETMAKYHEAIGEETQREDVPGYIEEGSGINLPGGYFMMPNLPYADLAKIPHSMDSLKEFLSNINPIIRAPVEMAVNEELFSGRPLEWYRGEKSQIPVIEGIVQQLAGTDLPDVIPKRTIGHILNQIPMLRNVDVIVDPENPRSFTRLLSFLGLPPMYPDETVYKASKYEERDRLRAVIRMLIDQGINIPTVTDINKGRIF